MKCVIGHRLAPSWMNLGAGPVTIAKGCCEGAPESPILWNMVLDDALGDAARRWNEKGYRVALPISAVDGRNRHPRREVDASHRLRQTVFSDEATLAAKNYLEAQHM